MAPFGAERCDRRVAGEAAGPYAGRFSLSFSCESNSTTSDVLWCGGGAHSLCRGERAVLL